MLRLDAPPSRKHEDISGIALAQRGRNARVITASLSALTFLASLATLALPSAPWMPPFLAATATTMGLAYWLARQGQIGVAIALTTACVFIEHIGSVAISGQLGPVPYIAPVALLVVAATGTARWLSLAFVATLLALGFEGALTPWTMEAQAAIVTAGLFAALIFVVSLLHVRGVERAFAVAEKQARARDRAARQALESEQRYRLIAESADDLIALVKRDGEVVYMSPSHERVLGLPVSVLQTGRLPDHLRIHNLQDLAAHFEQAFVVGHGRTEMRIARADGALRTFDVRMRRVESEASELLAIISRDVSEQRALEDRLHSSERMEALGRLAGSVAHDFNNLLTVIQCSAEIGRERLPDVHPAREDLEAVLHASGTAAALAEQLLTFSRRQLVVRVPIEIGGVLLEQRDILTRLAGPRVQLELHLAPDLPRVVIPKSHVAQLAMNLTTNARDAMPNGGVLTITTRVTTLDDRQVEDLVAGEYVELQVRDSGEGIETDVISRVFEPLFSTKGGLGTGLGLATCQAIATQTGGAICVHSVVGSGTTFNVYLPTDRDAKASEPVQRSQGRNLKHVLLVDDDANLRDLVTRMLRADGFDVRTASTLAEARSLLDDPGVMVDALISDIVLGAERGTDLLEPCRKVRPNAGILLMSGYTPEAGAEQALVSHRATFLSKPFGRDQLLAALRRA